MARQHGFARFRLRTLLAALVVLSAVVAIVVGVLRTKAKQWAIIDRLAAASHRASSWDTSAWGEWSFWPPHYELTGLILGGANIDGPSARELAELRYLTSLFIWDCKLSPDVLESVASLERVEELQFAHCPLDDGDLMNLRTMKSLKYLYLSDTGVTDEAVDQIRKALPELEVFDD
ncbi:MAG TPA: hypothetical protein VHV77_08825 [Pirellulales bacterium]|jgi:hypothetical protein|nr:hypothetical protein [Pirellulales bacterium]